MSSQNHSIKNLQKVITQRWQTLYFRGWRSYKTSL